MAKKYIIEAMKYVDFASEVPSLIKKKVKK